METAQTETDGICVCAVEGDIDLYSAQELHQAWQAHAAKAHAKPFVLNMDKTAYLDSSGIGVLVQIFADAKKKGIPFRICNVHGMAEKLLHLGRMDAILPVSKDIDDAIKRIKDDKK